jgi:glutamate racemase
MKIGVFDSGLGGLFTTKALVKALPKYDYVYLGDTKRVPYGNRSHEVIYEFLKEGIDFLFAQDCAIIIVACNTASAEALRILQQTYLPKKYPDKKVLGMIVPIVEECAQFKRVGLIGTSATISSGAYLNECKKRAPGVQLFSLATPLLVPLIENNGKKYIKPILTDYLKAFKGKKLDALILGCTHYPIIKKEIASLLPKGVKIISQDTVLPKRMRDYLKRHAEIETKLSKKGTLRFCVTDVTEEFTKRASAWFGKKIKIENVVIER